MSAHVSTRGLVKARANASADARGFPLDTLEELLESSCLMVRVLFALLSNRRGNSKRLVHLGAAIDGLSHSTKIVRVMRRHYASILRAAE